MVNWITDKIGTAAFDDVINFEDIQIIDVRELVDKKGNLGNVINNKIQKGLEYLNEGKKIIVCCDYGISRSNSIAAAIISRFEDIPFNNAIRRVIEISGEKGLNLSVLSAIRRALGEIRDSSEINSLESKKILLTGGSGFVGSELIERFSNKFEFIAPSHEQLDLIDDKVELDLLVKDNNINLIIHLAKPQSFTTNKTLGESITMLKNVLEVCQQNNIKLIYLSGWVIYTGYTSKPIIATENLKPYPLGTEGESKCICELLIKQHKRTYDLDALILRVSVVYGGKEKPKFIFNFLQKALKNEEIIAHEYLNGYPHMDLLYIDDLLEVIEISIIKNISGIYNIGTGIGISTTEVVKILIEIVGSKSKLTHRKIDNNAPNIVMDISRAKKDLNWTPKIDIIKGLTKTLKKIKNSQN